MMIDRRRPKGSYGSGGATANAKTVSTKARIADATIASIMAPRSWRHGSRAALGSADLHIHTRHGDGMATVPELLQYVAERGGLDVIAITEHDTLRAADEARDLHARGDYPFGLICGEEVTTLDGHLLALFIDEPLESFRRMEETLVAIHRQRGPAVVPHPLSWLTRSVTA